MKAYKIRDKNTGLFSRGGSYNYDIWSKNGKTWANIGHVKSHLRQFFDSKNHLSKTYPYDNAEIVEIEINYDACPREDVNDFIKNMVGESNGS